MNANLRLAVRVRDAVELAAQDGVGERHVANREVDRQVRFVGFGERQSRDCLPMGPHVLEPGERVSVVRRRCGARRTTAALALVVVALSEAASQDRFEVDGEGPSLGGRREPPEQGSRRSRGAAAD